jgi:cytochrome c-type biogenesis protein
LTENVTLGLAFLGGLMSFISPCVLPLIPGYLSFISGLSLDEMRGTPARGGAVAVVTAPTPHVRRRVVVASLAFILGFTIVFVLLGASASVLGQYVMARRAILEKIGGAIIVILGLHTMGVLRIEWLYQEKRVHTQRQPTSPFGAMLVGMAFAFGWTPCLGPILAGIITLAGTRDSVGEGVRLLVAYSLGLGVPFLATALALNQFFAALAKIRRHYHKIELVSGALLIAVGLLIFTGRFTAIAQWLTPYLPSF